MTGLPLALVLAYLTGSIPVARALSQLWAGIDIHKFGTGNPGSANVYRNVGLVPAGIVALANFLQGLGPVLLARVLGLDEIQVMFVGLAAMSGYGWPPTQGSRGGRGVAITLGVISAFSAGGAAALAGLFLVCIPIRRTSIATFAGFLALPVYMILTGSPAHVVALSGLAVTYILIRRLWGIWDYKEKPHGISGVIVQRLIFDASPRKRLVGPKIDRITERAGREPI